MRSRKKNASPQSPTNENVAEAFEDLGENFR